MYSNWVSLFDRGQRRGSIIFLEWAGWWDGLESDGGLCIGSGLWFWVDKGFGLFLLFG